jgi:hypothetical protein
VDKLLRRQAERVLKIKLEEFELDREMAEELSRALLCFKVRTQ